MTETIKIPGPTFEHDVRHVVHTTVEHVEHPATRTVYAAPLVQPADPTYGRIGSVGESSTEKEDGVSLVSTAVIIMSVIAIALSLWALSMNGAFDWLIANRPSPVEVVRQDRFVPAPQVVVPQQPRDEAPLVAPPPVDVPRAPQVNNPGKQAWIDACIAHGARIYTSAEWNAEWNTELPRGPNVLIPDGASRCFKPSRRQ